MLVLLLGLLANASCAHIPEPQDEAADPARTPMQRAQSAVEIYTECGSGSGVLIDGAHVITAFHVINCSDSPTAPELAKVIAIRTLDKQTSVATVEVGDGDRDLARLLLSDPVDGVVPVTIRTAHLNEIICASTAVPEREFRCGVVDSFDGPRSHGDVVIKHANVWYGNSGSGVYGQDGALVGITVRLNWCSVGDAYIFMLTQERVETCGGRVSSISDSPVQM